MIYFRLEFTSHLKLLKDQNKVIGNVLESLKNRMYNVGMTGDLHKQSKEHNAGRSKLTSSNSSRKIIYTEGAKDFMEGRKEKNISKPIRERNLS